MAKVKNRLDALIFGLENAMTAQFRDLYKLLWIMGTRVLAIISSVGRFF